MRRENHLFYKKENTYTIKSKSIEIITYFAIIIYIVKMEIIDLLSILLIEIVIGVIIMNEKSRKYFRIIMAILWIVVGGVFAFTANFINAILFIAVGIVFGLNAFKSGKKE